MAPNSSDQGSPKKRSFGFSARLRASSLLGRRSSTTARPGTRASTGLERLSWMGTTASAGSSATAFTTDARLGYTYDHRQNAARALQRAPLVRSAEDPLPWKGALSSYAYSVQNPLRFFDPLGLAPVRNNSDRPIPYKPEARDNLILLCLPGQQEPRVQQPGGGGGSR